MGRTISIRGHKAVGDFLSLWKGAQQEGDPPAEKKPKKTFARRPAKLTMPPTGNRLYRRKKTKK